MQVILLERVEKLGAMGDTVRVKDGYARNFLLPQNKALRATKGNMERFETQRAQLEATNLERRSEAESVADKVSGESYVVIRQAGETGQLYGSVTTRDIASLVTTGGMTTSRNQVILDTPIKTVGLHEVRIALHPEVNGLFGRAETFLDEAHDRPHHVEERHLVTAAVPVTGLLGQRLVHEGHGPDAPHRLVERILGLG